MGETWKGNFTSVRRERSRRLPPPRPSRSVTPARIASFSAACRYALALSTGENLLRGAEVQGTAIPRSRYSHVYTTRGKGARPRFQPPPAYHFFPAPGKSTWYVRERNYGPDVPSNLRTNKSRPVDLLPAVVFPFTLKHSRRLFRVFYILRFR